MPLVLVCCAVGAHSAKVSGKQPIAPGAGSGGGFPTGAAAGVVQFQQQALGAVLVLHRRQQHHHDQQQPEGWVTDFLRPLSFLPAS